MKSGPLLWFGAGYISAVAICVWLNISILCRGDPKLDRGCGGFELYFMVWLVFTSPIAIVAAIAAGQDLLTHRVRIGFLIIAALVILGALQIAFSSEGMGLPTMYGSSLPAVTVAFLVAWRLSVRERSLTSEPPVA